eukprot:31083-Pelagococcus_subviridis.AAC.25
MAHSEPSGWRNTDASKSSSGVFSGGDGGLRGGGGGGASFAFSSSSFPSSRAAASGPPPAAVPAGGARIVRGGGGASFAGASASRLAESASSHARSTATALPTPASHSSAPTRSSCAREMCFRPGASTCAAHLADASAPNADATSAGAPDAHRGRSAIRISAHRRTAALHAAMDGNFTPGITVVGCDAPGNARGTSSCIHSGSCARGCGGIGSNRGPSVAPVGA